MTEEARVADVARAPSARARLPAVGFQPAQAAWCTGAAAALARPFTLACAVLEVSADAQSFASLTAGLAGHALSQ